MKLKSNWKDNEKIGLSVLMKKTENLASFPENHLFNFPPNNTPIVNPSLTPVVDEFVNYRKPYHKNSREGDSRG